MIMLAAAAGLSVGCTQLEEFRTVSPDEIVRPVLNSINPSEIKVTNSILDDEVTFAWDAADFGVRTGISYNLEVEYGESGKIVVFQDITATSLKITYEELNYVLGLDTILGGAGVPLDVASEVKFYISAYIGDGAQKCWSDPKECTVTVIYAKPRYPNVWVIGKYSNWEHSRSQYLYSFGNDGVYEGLIDFGEDADTDNYGDGSDCGFKLTGAANWSNSTGNWGMNRAITDEDCETDEITLGNGGGNINKVYRKRYYQFRYTVNSLLLEKLLSFEDIDIAGTAAGEEAPQLLFDSANQRFYFDIEAESGETLTLTLKKAVRQGGDTDGDILLGASGEASAEPLKGTLELGSDKPLTVSEAGSSRVYIEMNNPEEMTWECNSDDFGKDINSDEEITTPNGETWGIVGTMTDWGGKDDPATDEDESVPDIPMIETGDWFKAASVQLTASDAFKIRFANAWNEDNTDNFGGSNGDVIKIQLSGGSFLPATKALSEGGSNNISVDTDGTYDLYFNPELGALHVRPEGSETPGDVTWGVTGSMTGWTAGDDLLLEEVDGTDYYILKDIELVGPDDEDAEQSQFKIRYGNWWNQNSDNGRGFSAGTGALEEGRTVSLIADGGSSNITVAETGVYNIYFYPNQNAVMIRSGEDDVPATVGWGITGYWTGWAENADDLMTYENGYNAIKGIEIPAYDESCGSENGFRIRYGNTDGGREYGMPAGESQEIGIDKTVRLSSDASAQNITVAPGTYDIYFDADNGIIYVNTPGTAAPSPYSIGICAEKLTAGIPDIPMTLNGSYYVYYTAVFPEDDSIRIRLSDNDGISYGVSEQPFYGAVNTEIPLVEGEDQETLEVPAGSYQIWFDMNASKLYVMTDGRRPETAYRPGQRPELPQPEQAPAFDEGLLDYKVAGVNNGWSDEIETGHNDVGLLYWTNLVFSEGSEDVNGGHFKIKLAGSWDNATTYGADAGTVFAVGSPVVVKSGAGNILVSERAEPYDIYMDFTNKVIFLVDSGETDVLEFGIVGDMVGWENDVAPSGEMSGYPGVYVWRDIEFDAGDSFKIRHGGSWIYQFSAGTDLSDRTKADAYFNGDNMSVLVPGTYDVYFDYPNKKVWIDKQ